MIDLRLGRWQDTLADVTTCDAVISDSPYSQRTHEATNGHVSGSDLPDGSDRLSIAYAEFSAAHVSEFVSSWAPRCMGWFASMTSHDLIPAWESAYEAAGLYAFAPVPIIQKRPRLVGDGPSSWAVYLMVARPRNREFATWGCLPGAYEAPTVKGSGIAGCKPLGLMRALVRDYSRPGDLIVDPFCGSGTTALAAASEGRRCVTSEELPDHYEIARRRFARGYTPDLF
jgi:site-specific DNA-methyltransferase (adenine-specific)